MIIGIDGNEANIESRVGVNQYGCELLKALHKLNLKKNVGNKVIVYLKNRPIKELPQETNYWRYVVIPPAKAWVLTKLTPYIYKTKDRPDVFFSLSHYLPPLLPIPSVCSIMDLGYLEFSEQFEKRVFWQLKYWTAISLFVSNKVISISESTKKDIVRHYKYARDKVYVIHLAYDRHRFNKRVNNKDVRRVKRKYSIVNDYILFLGTLKPNKNVEGLLQAYKYVLDDYLKDKKEYDLVIAGKKGWLYESVFENVRQLGLEKKVIFTDFVKESHKPALLKGAKMLVSPSYWEGFGLHILESMACGTPVVVSYAGSIPEIVESAGIYVNQENPRSIAKGIVKVLDMSSKEYTKLVDRGYKQVRKFSWEKTAKNVLKVLESLDK
jgi:glycosyltransferase involved in cell wall biosynthesis